MIEMVLAFLRRLWRAIRRLPREFHYDLAGKHIIVTGANSGIGLEAAIELARMGADLTLTARSDEKGQAAVDWVRSRSGNVSADYMILDLGDLSSIRTFAADYSASHDRLDVLLNNAGLTQSERTETKDGFETCFGVNHLGTFLLTNLLLPLLKASAPARIVTVASLAHRQAGRLDFDDLMSERGRFVGLRVYAKSKLANILFTRELARRLGGSGVTANCLHPGTIRSGFGREGDTKGFLAFGIRLAAPFFISPAKGAETSIFLAADPTVDEKSGGYWDRCRLAKASATARDDNAAARLWDVSAELVGLEAAS